MWLHPLSGNVVRVLLSVNSGELWKRNRDLQEESSSLLKHEKKPERKMVSNNIRFFSERHHMQYLTVTEKSKLSIKTINFLGHVAAFYNLYECW